MTWHTQATDPFDGDSLGVVRVRTHPESACAGRPCVVHAPSDHRMRDWPTVWRADKGVTERQCPHGVGHPDPDDVAWQVSQGREWAGTHGCDGCCRPSSAAARVSVRRFAGDARLWAVRCPSCPFASLNLEFTDAYRQAEAHADTHAVGAA